MFRATDMFGNNEYDWKTIPKLRKRAGTFVRLAPSSETSPASGASRPAITRRNGVLRQPDGPRKQTNSPASMRRLTSSSARTLPKRLVMLRSDRSTMRPREPANGRTPPDPAETNLPPGGRTSARRRRSLPLYLLLPLGNDAILVLLRGRKVPFVKNRGNIGRQPRLDHRVRGLGTGHRGHLGSFTIELGRLEGQQPVEELLRILLVLCRLHQRIDLGFVARAFAWNHELDRVSLHDLLDAAERERHADRIFAGGRGFARPRAGLDVLRDVLVEILEVVPAFLFALHLQQAHDLGVARPGAGGVRHYDLSLVDWVQQVLPRRRHRQIVLFQHFGVHAKACEISRRREPAALRVLELRIDLVDTDRAVGLGALETR